MCYALDRFWRLYWTSYILTFIVLSFIAFAIVLLIYFISEPGLDDLFDCFLLLYRIIAIYMLYICNDTCFFGGSGLSYMDFALLIYPLTVIYDELYTYIMWKISNLSSLECKKYAFEIFLLLQIINRLTILLFIIYFILLGW